MNFISNINVIIFNDNHDSLFSSINQIISYYYSQDSDSTSYYNIAEIEEITDRVEELFNNWPEEWGVRKADQIGVVTAYMDQVHKIRVSLRKRKKELRDVVVERVMNVQGMDYSMYSL